MNKIREGDNMTLDVVRSSTDHEAAYVDFSLGLELCQANGLVELGKRLAAVRRVWQDAVSGQKLSEFFIEIRGFSTPVMFSRFDFRVNASNILRLAGRRRDEMDKLRKALPTHTYEILLGSHATRGTYVDFEIGIQLCQKYQLPRLEERLQSLQERPRKFSSLSRRSISPSRRPRTISPIPTYGLVRDPPPRQPLDSTIHVGKVFSHTEARPAHQTARILGRFRPSPHSRRIQY